MTDMIFTHLADRLHDIFPNNHANRHLGYIKLENIHPLTDPEVLRETGELLNDRNIPFLMSVKPVYVEPSTNDIAYLKDYKHLLNVIHDLQKENGTVVLNGYSNDQYLEMEFWDAMYDQPIFKVADNEVRVKQKQMEQFARQENYVDYVKETKKKEKDYVQHRLEQALHDVVKEDVYPLAFSPTFSAMSQEGYGTASQYFSTMIGNVQLSDRSSQSIYTPPFKTTANFLHGMDVYPETVGDISNMTSKDHAINSAKIAEAQIVRDSVIGMSYQTYLGANKLENRLDELEKLFDINWLHLRHTEQEVQTNKINIQSSENTTVQVTDHFTWKDSLKEWTNQFTFLEKILWVITLLVFTFVVLFLLFALYLRLQLKKRLFRERK